MPDKRRRRCQVLVEGSRSSVARPVTGVVKKTSSLSSAALNTEHDEHLTAVLTADDGHNDRIEHRVDGEHVQCDVGEDTQMVDVDEVVVGQQRNHVERQQTEHDDDDEHNQPPACTTTRIDHQQSQLCL